MRKHWLDIFRPRWAKRQERIELQAAVVRRKFEHESIANEGLMWKVANLKKQLETQRQANRGEDVILRALNIIDEPAGIRESREKLMADRNMAENEIRHLGVRFARLEEKHQQAVDARDTAWAEIREIREALKTPPDEATADDVRALVSLLDLIIGEPDKSATERLRSINQRNNQRTAKPQEEHHG